MKTNQNTLLDDMQMLIIFAETQFPQFIVYMLHSFISKTTCQWEGLQTFHGNVIIVNDSALSYHALVIYLLRELLNMN